MKRVALFFVILVLGIKLPAQINEYGIPLIRNYENQITNGSEQNWCITEDKLGNIYFGSQDRGVIRYDGTKWNAIRIGNNPRIYSLAADSGGLVYVGAAFEFGYIQPDEKGKPEYISLVQKTDSIPEIETVHTIVIHEGKVYFLSPKVIYIYDIQQNSVSKIKLSEYKINVAFRLVKINEKLIIADNATGIFELKENIITPLPGGDFFKSKICTVLLPYDENQILIGTFYDGIFLYNYKTGIVRSNFIDDKLNKKLKAVSVYSGAKLEKEIFAIGTTNTEGLLVFNKSGKLIQQINVENSDLEDNTMMAMYCDYRNKSELWLSTYGVISKVYFNIPLTKFAEKQGIESGINEICRFHDNYYLSSDAGIMKSYINDKNNFAFKKVEGINTQVFPLKVINTPSGELLLAGSLNGILQISENDEIRKVENICSNWPKGKLPSLNIKKIVQSKSDPGTVYFGLEMGGILVLNFDGHRWTYKNRVENIPGLVSGIVTKNEGGLWFLTDDPSGLYSWRISGKDTSTIKYGPEKGIPEIDLNSIVSINDDLYVNTAAGILKYDKSQDKFVSGDAITGGFSAGQNALMLFQDAEGDIWFSRIDKNDLEVLFRKNINSVDPYLGILNLLPNVPSLDIKYFDGKVYFIKSKIICVVDKSRLQTDTTLVNTLFSSITLEPDSVVMTGTFHKNIDQNRRLPVISSTSATVSEFKYDFNEIYFEWTTPDFTEELLTEYSYKLEGFDENWSKWEGISFGNTMEALYSKKGYGSLPYGHYNFRLRTRTLTGQKGNELNYEFIILKPWYATILAYFGFALIAFIIIISIIKAYTRKLKNENIRLEGIVAERTAVVVKQKDELESSIHYASRIQMALLPSERVLSEYIKNYFVLFKPRDIVSGDFYWITKKGQRLYIVVADCTGHGVPGAFMSLLGMSFLDEIIDKDISPRADFVLGKLRLHVTESLKQVGGDDEAKDGMDIALLVIDSEKQRIEFSGAYNSCFRVRKLTVTELKNYSENSLVLADGSLSNGRYLLETIFASKMPIGISSRMNEDFVCYENVLEKGVSFYLFSDGYIDQFGGPDGRKFMKKNFKRLILDIQDHPMNKQKEILEKSMNDWMGSTPQIDDILVMGIRTE